MARTAKVSKPAAAPALPPVVRIEYDGYYRVDAVGKNGQKFSTYSRGYKLKSWLDFEKSLGSEVTFSEVPAEEFEAHQWYNTPFEDEPAEPVAKKSSSRDKPKAEPAKKTAAKPAKKAVKKPAAKKAAPAKKVPVKKSTTKGTGKSEKNIL